MDYCNDYLHSIHGQLCELSGEQKEFKRQTLDRLASLEQEIKNRPKETRNWLCMVTSFISALVSVATLNIRGKI